MKNSKKRQAQLRAYQKVKQELEKELKDQDKWYCFFSGIPFPDHTTWKEVTWHHIAGRTDDLLSEKEFLVPVYDRYHTGDEGWHNTPLSKLKDFYWFDGFMERLKEKSYDLWQRVNYKLKECS